MRGFWGLLLGSLVLFGCGEVRQENSGGSAPQSAATDDPLSKDVQRATWFGPKHTPMGKQLRDINCRGDYNLHTLTQGQRLWVLCAPSEHFYGGTLMSIEPTKGEILAYWPFPQEIPLASIEGIAPLPNDQLAVLYQVRAPSREKPLFALAITGAEGWAMYPQEISGMAIPQGIAWIKDGVEVVFDTKVSFQYRQEELKSLTIVRMTPDGKREDRSFALSCPAGESCELYAAYPRKGENQWRAILSTNSAIFEQSEGDALEPSALPKESANRLDLSVSGIVGRSVYAEDLKAILTPEGKILAHEEAPRGVERELYEAHSETFTIKDGYLRSYCLWEMVGSRAIVQKINGRTLRTDIIKSTGMLAITDATNPAQPKEKQVGPVAGRILKWRCSDLAEGAFLEKPEGGYWLVGESGCYISLPPVW